MFHKILALLLALTLCACAALGEPVASLSPAASPSPDTGDGTDAAKATPQPASAYVLVSTATQMGFLPLPDEGEYSYHLKQILPDGTPAENVIHLTPDSVWMEDSTCENHDCVQQGEVTIDNRRDRILGNMIICLPNQVTLQLLTPEEIEEMTEGKGLGNRD